MIDAGQVLLIAIGGGLGGVLRIWVSETVGRWGMTRFPWGTLIVNVTGALLIGLLAAGLTGSLQVTDSVVGSGAGDPDGALWAFLTVGVLGSYTTVSSFSLQTLSLMQNGEIVRAGWNVVLSFGLCLSGAAIGYLGGGFFLGG